MLAKILDGRALSKKKLNDLKFTLNKYRTNFHRQPCLAVIIIGEIPESHLYVDYKVKACQELNIKSVRYEFKNDLSQEDLINCIMKLNSSNDIDGILIQLPLPKHISTALIKQTIAPHKDVDGFHPLNMGLLLTQLPGLRPCTPKGIMSLLEETGEPIEGKHAVILGASFIVGRPIALELLSSGATVTICHDKTQKIQKHIAQADILIVAIGNSQYVHGSWCKPGSIIIDVGINRLSAKVTGDVDFDSASKVASWITPVPGGVGPMTIAALMENTIFAYKVNNGL